MTHVLAINCGSASLKFRLIDANPDSPDDQMLLAKGTVDQIGEQAKVHFTTRRGTTLLESLPLRDHAAAVDHVLAWLASTGHGVPDAIGHRVVHGGRHFSKPTPIDDALLTGVLAADRLGPLHNRPALDAMVACREALGPRVPMVAVFDTAFFTQLPDVTRYYPIPYELTERFGIRRYGLHGLAHRSMWEGYLAVTGGEPEAVKLITLQLGSGCSAAAIAAGRPIDVSMGFSSLEGLMMSASSGDVDPSLVGFLARELGVGLDTIDELLHTRAGLLGVSGLSGDMRELLAADDRGNDRACLAVRMFWYRARKYAGAYLAALGGADAIVFGGGIGEHAPEIRAHICAGLEWCGLELDHQRNGEVTASPHRISTAASRLQAFIVPVDEERLIAHDTVACLNGVTRSRSQTVAAGTPRGRRAPP